MKIRIVGAKVVVADDIIETDVLVEDGRIAAIGNGGKAEHEINAVGKLLGPAMVDIHGDAHERQIMPRPKVFFPLDAAILETDRQLAANGIATAYHALTLSWEPGLRSVERGEEFLDALVALESRLTVENRVQLRWETFAFEAVDIIEKALASPHLPSIAFNDHTSMTMRHPDVPVQERLFEHNPDFQLADPDSPIMSRRLVSDSRRSGLSVDEYGDLIRKIWERRPQVQDTIGKVARMGREKAVPMLSHDDTQDETRDFYRGHGASIAEFPMRIPVARNARAAGDAIVFGAPNVVRGGSHIGSPSAADMVEDGLCDILASDYFYPAMLTAVARLDREKRAPLPALWSLVSAGPAKASGLDDRGEIAVGKRADLILVDWPEDGPPAVKMTMSAGRLAYQAYH